MAVPPTLIALAIDKLSQDLLLSLPTILTPQAILDGTFHKISQDSPRIAQALFDKISQDSPRSFPPILIVQAILDGISQDSQRSFTPILIAQGILDGTLELDGMSQYSLRIAQALFDKVSQDSWFSPHPTYSGALRQNIRRNVTRYTTFFWSWLQYRISNLGHSD
jgi:hypothetical protein